jgi:hypothetical protein
MHAVSVTRHINKSGKEIWQTLDKFADVYIYHPHVKHSESINEIPTGRGAERTCHFEDGNLIKERIISYDNGNQYEVEGLDKNLQTGQVITRDNLKLNTA